VFRSLDHWNTLALLLAQLQFTISIKLISEAVQLIEVLMVLACGDLDEFLQPFFIVLLLIEVEHLNRVSAILFRVVAGVLEHIDNVVEA
jgi:hypothetical protein